MFQSMKITQDFKCFVGLHKYEIQQERKIVNPYDATIGTTIVCRCNNCGKIKEYPIFTDFNYRRLI